MNKANQFDVIRSYSKDKYYRSKQLYLFKNYLDFFFKKLFLTKYDNEIELASDLLYYSSTTLLNKQTIGQEYFNLIYLDNKTSSLLSKQLRIKLILLKLIVPYLINRLSTCSRLDYKLKFFICLTKIALIIAHRINKISFLFNNSFYNLENLFANVKLVSVNTLDRNNNNSESLNTFKLIAFINILTFLIQIFYEVKILNVENTKIKATTKTPGLEANKACKQLDNVTCLLCLDKIKEPTSTMCGHIFCWSCIQKYIFNLNKNSNQITCPSCRMPITENKVIYLHNF